MSEGIALKARWWNCLETKLVLFQTKPKRWNCQVSHVLKTLNFLLLLGNSKRFNSVMLHHLAWRYIHSWHFLKHSGYYMKIYTIIINLVEHKNNNRCKQNVLQYQKEKFCLIKLKVTKQKKLGVHLDFFVSIFIQIDIYLQSIFVFMKVYFSSRKYSIGMSHLQFFPLLGSWSTFRSTRNAGSTFIFRLWSL